MQPRNFIHWGLDLPSVSGPRRVATSLIGSWSSSGSKILYCYGRSTNTLPFERISQWYHCMSSLYWNMSSPFMFLLSCPLWYPLIYSWLSAIELLRQQELEHVIGAHPVVWQQPNLRRKPASHHLSILTSWATTFLRIKNKLLLSSPHPHFSIELFRW